MKNIVDMLEVDKVSIDLLTVTYSVIMSLLSAYLIKRAYEKYGRSLANKINFSDNFLILSLSTCVVIIVIKYSLALSLGLVGALSIVRFRAAIKEPEEIVYLFSVIVVGLAYGAGQFKLGIIATIAIIIVSYSLRNFGESGAIPASDSMILIISGEQEAVDNWMREAFQEMKDLFSEIRLSSLVNKSGNIKLIYRVVLDSEIGFKPEILQKFINKENINSELHIDFVSAD